jgi:hypothetical protein
MITKRVPIAVIVRSTIVMPVLNIIARFVGWSGLDDDGWEGLSGLRRKHTNTACSIRRVPKVCKFISVFSTIIIMSLVASAVIVLSTIVIPAFNIYARFVETAVAFRGGRLSEAEERTVSVLTSQEAKIADAIMVTYRDDNNGGQKDGELHLS